MNKGTAATPNRPTEGYKNLDGAPANSGSETLTLAHATLHTAITDGRADSNLREYGAYVDYLIWAIDLLELSADDMMSAIGELLLDPPFEAEPGSEPYDLLACLVETMKVLGIANTNTISEYVEALSHQVVSDITEDDAVDRKLRPGLLDVTIVMDPNCRTVN
jgi:hypothetical protein